VAERDLLPPSLPAFSERCLEIQQNLLTWRTISFSKDYTAILLVDSGAQPMAAWLA
jgi:hypothetical protein